MNPQDVISLREYIESLIASERQMREAAREADKDAVEKALDSAQQLAEKHNDLIRQMQERDKTYVSQEVYDERHKALQDRVDQLQSWQARMVGGMVVLATIGVTTLVRLLAGG